MDAREVKQRKDRITQEPKRVGRPHKLTPARIEKICDAIRVGNYRRIAAGAAGISDTTFYHYVNRGRVERARREQGKEPDDNEDIFVQFLGSLEKAETEGEAIHVLNIAEQGPEGSKWILGRRHPDRWQASQKVNLEGNLDVNAVDHILDALPDDVAEAIRTLLEGKLNEASG